MRGLAVRLGIIALIAGGAWLLRPFFTGNAGSLAVGDCFDKPPGNAPVVQDVQRHPCTEPHDAEVLYVGIYEPASDPHPSEDQFTAFIRTRCIPAFASYTGRPYESATDLMIEWYHPTAQGWSGGDRKVICFVIRADLGTLTESIKAR